MKTNAFTLLEIVISMLILSIATAGVYGLFVTNYKLLTMAKHDLQAINQAGKVIEKLRMYVAEVMVPELPEHASLVFLAGNHISVPGPDNDDFNRMILTDTPDIPGTTGQEWSYSVEDNISSTDCKKVIVTVRRNEP